MSAISLFRSIENKHDLYSGKDCMKTFCEFLREHAMKIIRKKRKLLVKEQHNHMKMQKSVKSVAKNLKVNN